MVILVVAVALVQGLIAEHTPAIMKSLSGTEMAEMLAATLPEPTWQQAYAGWMKNLAQVIALALLAAHAMSYAALCRNGDIPFILTKCVRRSHYLGAGMAMTWLATVWYSIVGGMLAWIGSIFLFPEAPMWPVLAASLVWALTMILISAFQMLAAILRPGVGGPLLIGLGSYLLIVIAGSWEKLAKYSPLGLSQLSGEIASQTVGISWGYTVGTAVAVLGIMTWLCIVAFNRVELA